MCVWWCPETTRGCDDPEQVKKTGARHVGNETVAFWWGLTEEKKKGRGAAPRAQTHRKRAAILEMRNESIARRGHFVFQGGDRTSAPIHGQRWFAQSLKKYFVEEESRGNHKNQWPKLTPEAEIHGRRTSTKWPRWQSIL